MDERSFSLNGSCYLEGARRFVFGRNDQKGVTFKHEYKDKSGRAQRGVRSEDKQFYQFAKGAPGRAPGAG